MFIVQVVDQVLELKLNNITAAKCGAKTLSTVTLSIVTLSIMTLSITTLSITTLSIMTLSILTLSILTLSKITYVMTLSRRFYYCHAEF
jgi:hypothetical protein